MELLDIDIHDERVRFVEAKPAGWAGYIAVKDVHEALELMGIPPQLWPKVPSDNRCLERAMQDLRSDRNLIRPLRKGRGWALVVENADALDLERLPEEAEDVDFTGVRHAHTVEITAKVERALEDRGTSQLRITPEDHPAAPLIRDKFEYHRGTGDDNPGMFKASQDLSVWFSQTVIPWVHGVSTRSRGGSYYVLKGINLSRLNSVAEAMAVCSTYLHTGVTLPDGTVLHRTRTVVGGRIILKPEFGTRIAVEVMLDSLFNETDKICDDEHKNMTTGAKGTRALTSSTKRLDSQQVKLKEWGDMLGVALTDMEDRLNEIAAANGLLSLKLLAET